MNTNEKQTKCPKCGCSECEIISHKVEGAILGECSNKKCRYTFLVQSTDEYEALRKEPAYAEAKCPHCGSSEYLISPYKSHGSIWGHCSNYKCQKAFLIISTPEYEEWRQDFAQRHAEKTTESKVTLSTSVVKCSYCGSTNVKKISGTSRWLSTGLFGLASNKIGKNFHCNKCGSDF